ncbi:hypothetical protein [Arsukibacterium sp.]|uniref:hypothetical protein n=1 Tax=Arsukibacterium sp. TaxID=1977258 RepID=UPI002FDA1505
MKKLTLIAGMLLGSSSVFAAQAAEQLAGHWRGVLQFSAETGVVLGIELTPEADGYQMTLISPNQSLTSIEPTRFTIDGNSLSFNDDSLRAQFSGEFDGNTLKGVFTQGRNMPITLTRLSAESVARLEHEQQWAGELMISRSASLPLVLNVAVIEEGYHVTLDSPKQQSFGIPITEFSITKQQLNFKSAMINASYQGNWQQDAWQGSFVQGQAMPLTLKKKPQ